VAETGETKHHGGSLLAERYFLTNHAGNIKRRQQRGKIRKKIDFRERFMMSVDESRSSRPTLCGRPEAYSVRGMPSRHAAAVSMSFKDVI